MLEILLSSSLSPTFFYEPGRVHLPAPNQPGIAFPNDTPSKTITNPITAQVMALLDIAILCSLPQAVARINPPTTIPITAIATPRPIRILMIVQIGRAYV